MSETMTTSDDEPPALRELVERLNELAVETASTSYGHVYRFRDTERDLLSQAAAALLAADARAREAERSRDHAHQWYAERLEPIKDVAKRVGVWDEVAAIIANGNGTRQLPDGSWKHEPPTYAQQLNIAKHKAEAAEAHLAAARARIATLEGVLREARAQIVRTAAHHWTNGQAEVAITIIDAALAPAANPEQK